MAQDQAATTTDTPVTPGGFWSRTFESLSVTNFRYLWFGSLLGMSGFQMQAIARTILVDELTGSAFITSIVGMGWAPTLLIFSMVGGVIGDRVERKFVIQASQAAAAFLTFFIGTLIAIDMIHWTHMLVASMIQGALFSFQMPARQAILPLIVGKERVTNAIALSSGAMSITGIVAPGIAGVLYNFGGPEAVYYCVGGMTALAVFVTSFLPRIPPEAAARTRKMAGEILDGIKYVGGNRVVLLVLVTGIATAMISMPFRMQMPVFARRLYESDASEIGWLMMLTGAGGVIGTIAIANLREKHPRGVVYLMGTILGGVGIGLVALFPQYAIGLPLMLIVGLASTFRMTLGQSLTLEATDGQYRARVMGLHMMIYGLTPLGALPVGQAVDVFGAQETLLVVGPALAIVGVLSLLASPTLRRL